MRKIYKIGIGVGIAFTVLSVVYVGLIFYVHTYNQQGHQEWDLENYSIDDCFWANKDTNGYLEKICKYIIENKIGGANEPTKYGITGSQEQEYKGREVIAVFLNCCYTGDVAYIDKETQEVIGFRLGDM